MIRVALFGIAGVLMALQLKALKPDYSVYLCLGVSLLIFSFVAENRYPGRTSGSSALPAFECRVYPHSDENHRHHLYCRVCF